MVTMEPKQKRSLDMIPPRRTTPAARPSMAPARPRKEPPTVDLRNMNPVVTATRPAAPQAVAINSAPRSVPTTRPVQSARPVPRPAPVTTPSIMQDDPLAEVGEIPAPRSVNKSVKRKGSFWRGFWKFLLVLVVLGLIASIAVFIYVTYNG